MDKGEFEKRWPQIRTQVRSRWNKLTEQDLESVRGNPELLIGLIQEKYEESRQAVEMQLKTLVERKEHVG